MPLHQFLNDGGAPHKRLPPTIHVAGTNGKGSTIAMLRAIYRAQGYKVHVMTSPHLYDITERLVLSNEQITQKQLWEALKAHKNLAKKHQLSWYEFLVGVSFVLASKTPADLMLLEVGLGGEFDATNVIETPILSLITPISLDHYDFLGKDLKGIAKAKAGIIKTNCPCLSAQQVPEVEAVLRETAQHIKAPLHFVSLSKKMVYKLNLPGKHQEDNAQLALEAVSLLQTILPVDHKAIEAGLQAIHWPGRLEYLGKMKGASLWFDVAHNPASAQAVYDFFIKRPGRKCLIFALLKSKDAPETVRPLVKGFDHLIFFSPKDSPRYHPPEDLVEIVESLEGKAHNLTTFSLTTFGLTTFESALDKALELEPKDLLIAGSHYFSGELSGVLLRKKAFQRSRKDVPSLN